MKVYEVQPRMAEPVLDGEKVLRVFLAGTIDMGVSDDWQRAAIERIAKAEGPDGLEFITGDRAKLDCGAVIVYNPRRNDWNNDFGKDELEYQINWELSMQEKADAIYMNIAEDSKSPITLLELGLFARSGKLRVVCPTGFYRYDNVRVTCGRYGVELLNESDGAPVAAADPAAGSLDEMIARLPKKLKIKCDGVEKLCTLYSNLRTSFSYGKNFYDRKPAVITCGNNLTEAAFKMWMWLIMNKKI